MNLIQKVFAQENPFGSVSNPLNRYGDVTRGLVPFISNILRLFFVVAGILALFNFLLAGFQYIQAAGDSKQLQQAWSRIWQTLLGLIIIVVSFALVSVVSYIIFGDAGYILNPQIYGPGSGSSGAPFN